MNPHTPNNLTDKDFFKFCLDSFPLLFHSDIAFIKDEKGCYKTASRKFVDLVQQDLRVNIINRYDFEIFTDEKILNKISHYFQQVVTNRVSSAHFVISLKNFDDTSPRIPFVNRLNPIINPHTNNVVGVLYICEPFYLLNMPLFIQKKHNLNRHNINDFEVKPNITLNEQQQIVLFLLCNFLTAAQIKDVYKVIGKSVSLGRITNIILELKNIFAIKSKNALLEKALHFNYHLNAPLALFPEIFYDIDDFILNIC